MRFKTLCLLTCLSMSMFACGEKESAQAPAPPPPAVSVVETKAQDVPIFLEFVGETHGLKDIAIRARVEGFLQGIHFKEGRQVKKGDMLYTLESQPFEEKVAARRSAVAEQETFLAKAKGDLDRIKPLAEINAVSQSDLDEAVAAYEAGLSSVEAAKANLRAAQIELSYTKIHSPIDGIIGQTLAKVGDFVGRSPNPVILNTVSQVETILVDFFITENQYLEIARHLEKAGSQAIQDADSVSMQLLLSDGSTYKHPGKVDFINREVDATSGAMLVQASFPNPDKFLRPGQFTKVRIKSHVVKDGILIPQRCVMEVQGLFSVFVIDGDDTAHTREITVGHKIGSDWLITKGLKSGERVVYEGLQKTKDGAKVEPTEATKNSTDQGKK